MTLTHNLEDRVTAALEAASARNAALTDEQRREIHMINVLAAHLVICCPVETLPGGDKHKWHRDLQPALNAPGCECGGNGFKILDADHFLAKRASAKVT